MNQEDQMYGSVTIRLTSCLASRMMVKLKAGKINVPTKGMAD